MTRIHALAAQRAVVCAVLCAALAACSAPAPVRYHTLLAPDAQAADSDGQQPAPFVIEVLPVAIPAQLDQSQLVVRQGGGGSLALPDDQRWAAPLDDEIRAALSAGLSRQLGTQDVAGLVRPSGQPLVRVKLQLRRMDAWLGQRVQLDAGWSLSMVDGAGHTGHRQTCQGRVEQAVDAAGYAALVQAQQRAIDTLARRIAADVRALAAGGATQCKQ